MNELGYTLVDDNQCIGHLVIIRTWHKHQTEMFNCGNKFNFILSEPPKPTNTSNKIVSMKNHLDVEMRLLKVREGTR